MSALPISSLFGGGPGGSSTPVQYLVVKKSRVWIAPFSGKLDVLIQAGHPSGSVSLGADYACAGSGAGETAMKFSIDVVQGDTYTITIGAGGPSVTRSTVGATKGVDGGDSSFVGPGANITVKGGKAGSAGSALPLNGGEGGEGGEGGDVHYPGGRGGHLSGTAALGWSTGSGAPNLMDPDSQTRTRGGDKSVPGNYSTGGGGICGRGGDLSSGSAAAPTGGGGYGGDAVDNPASESLALGGPNALLQASSTDGGAPSPAALVPAIAAWGLDVFGGGARGKASSATADKGGPGGGGGGAQWGGSKAGEGGFMGAPGGWAGDSGAGLGADGKCAPGASAAHRGSGPVTSGAGDSGIAILILRKG